VVTGDLARGRWLGAEADGAIVRVVFGLGCGVCKMFRDGRRDTDALLVGVEFGGVVVTLADAGGAVADAVRLAAGSAQRGEI
jgi:hypothetical protein